MNVQYSKDFEKSVRKLSGKILHSIIEMIDEEKWLHQLMISQIAKNRNP